MTPEKDVMLPGPYAPTLILHGGAGNITRKNLPPALYKQYETSLLKYLGSTRQRLNSGVSALDSAVHAVALMEDDPLFNCGRGSVFTEKGTIEMEASVMVASLDPDRSGRSEANIVAGQKRGASVSLVKGTRHPIELAKEVLLVKPDATPSSMHCQLSGPDVEEWGWEERGLERKDYGWFWTKRRWAEHLRGLQKDHPRSWSEVNPSWPQGDNGGGQLDDEDSFLPSEGTVGAVCMDSWGDVAVATSTGGMTNKKVGRIGDTPTLGAGFWAESWEESVPLPISNSRERAAVGCLGPESVTVRDRLASALNATLGQLLHACFPNIPKTNGDDDVSLPTDMRAQPCDHLSGGNTDKEQSFVSTTPRMPFERDLIYSKPRMISRRRVVAVSGTGNGDTFLRTVAGRTIAAICHYSRRDPECKPISLATAMNMIVGPDGEMQKSAGDRWKVTGEGQAGMIGIEIRSDCDAEKSTLGCSGPKNLRKNGRVVFDLNCGGLWRAWVDEETGKEKVMVYKDDYH